MQLDKRILAKNAAVMMTSQLVTWGFALLLTLFLPRYLGPTAIGELSLASSIWAIAAVFLGFGTETYLVKTVARTPEKAAHLLPATVTIRSVLFILSSFIVWAYINFMGYSPTVAIIAFFIGISVIGDLISGSITAVLTGLERMEFVSVASVVMKLVYTILCLTFIFLGLNVYWIAGASIFSVAIGIIILWLAVKRVSNISYSFRLQDMFAIMSSSYQYLITSLMLIIYQKVDSIFIASLVDAKAVGYYSTAMGLFGTMMFLPGVIGTVIFPMLSRGFAAGGTDMGSIVRRTFNLMFIISIPLGFGLTVVAKPFVQLVYGPEFAFSGQILSIFGVVLIFTYLNTFFGQLLVSMERTNRLNLTMLVAIIATFPLDLTLVPLFESRFQNGALGGAFSFLVTEFCQVIIALFLLPKRTLEWSNVRSIALTLFAGVVMIAITYLLREKFLLLPIIAGAVSYTIMILVLKVLPHDDLLLVKRVAERFQTRVRAAVSAAAPSSR